MSNRTGAITTELKNTASPGITKQDNSDYSGPIVGSSQYQRNITCHGNTFIISVRLINGLVHNVWSTGRISRNINVLLKQGLDTRGRLQFLQQMHCLCNDGHALAAIRTVEKLAGIKPPKAALLVRNIVQSLRGIHEHLLHFYQFNRYDWVNLKSALKASPAATARLAESEQRSTEFFSNIQAQFKAIDAKKDGSDLAFKFIEHEDYHGSNELHLLTLSHGLESLKILNTINSTLKELNCGPKGFKAYYPGGLPEDMNLSPTLLNSLQKQLKECLDFIGNIFFKDICRLAPHYSHWSEIGHGSSFLSCDDFINPDGEQTLFPGIMTTYDTRNGLSNSQQSCPNNISEEIDSKWKTEDRLRYRLNSDTGIVSFQWEQENVHWLTAPRHARKACEVGPMPRIIGSMASGDKNISQLVSKTFKSCGLKSKTINSTLGRVLSRGIESILFAKSARKSLEEIRSLPAKDCKPLQIKIDLPHSGTGFGQVEVPRGTLTHTIRLEKNRIASHDYLIPSMWNFSPSDSSGELGPLEQALIGTPVKNPVHPLEILRTVHELDPCNNCIVVVEDTDSGLTSVSKAN